MSSSLPEAFAPLIAGLYNAFADVPPPPVEAFCSHCLSQTEIDGLCGQAVAGLEAELGRSLLWDLSHHDEAAARYFLPRLLELLQADRIDELYPGHVCESLARLHLDAWSPLQRRALKAFMQAREDHIRAETAAQLRALYGDDPEQGIEAALAEQDSDRIKAWEALRGRLG